MIVFRRFARDERRSDVRWAAGVVAVVLVAAAFWPSVEGSESFDDVIQDLPANLQAMIGARGGASLGTPAGYLNARVFATVLPVILTVFAIGHGGRALAGSEEDGTLELVLVNPLSRTRLALERGLVVGGALIALGSVAFGAMVALGGPVGMLEGISLHRLVGACAGLIVLAGLHAAIAFGVGAATGRRALAVGSAATVAVAGYLVEGLLATSDELRWVRSISPWDWLLSRNVLVDGTPVLPLAVHFAIGAAIVVLGVVRFRTRDLR